MSIETFQIKILDINWIKKEDDPDDLCAHGHVYLKIGDELMSDKNAGDWNLSSAALSLMRTIATDYKIGDFGNQLLPCCGHFVLANEDEETVTILGCGNGIDWTINHTDGYVEHITTTGQRGLIDKEVYKKMIFDLADYVEEFYNRSKQKEIPEDDFDRRGYLTFWKEWRRLRNEIA